MFSMNALFRKDACKIKVCFNAKRICRKFVGLC